MVDTDLECSTWTYQAVVLVKYDTSVSRSPKFMKINMPDIFDCDTRQNKTRVLKELKGHQKTRNIQWHQVVPSTGEEDASALPSTHASNNFFFKKYVGMRIDHNYVAYELNLCMLEIKNHRYLHHTTVISCLNVRTRKIRHLFSYVASGSRTLPSSWCTVQ